MFTPYAITDLNHPLTSIIKLVDRAKSVRFTATGSIIVYTKTHKIVALQRATGVSLLLAKSGSVNPGATLSPSEVDDHRDAQVEDRARTKTLPQRPSAAEVAEHQCTHSPCRGAHRVALGTKRTDFKTIP